MKLLIFCFVLSFCYGNMCPLNHSQPSGWINHKALGTLNFMDTNKNDVLVKAAYNHLLVWSNSYDFFLDHIEEELDKFVNYDD